MVSQQQVVCAFEGLRRALHLEQQKRNKVVAAMQQANSRLEDQAQQLAVETPRYASLSEAFPPGGGLFISLYQAQCFV